MTALIVAIDGPAGAGKSTVARRVAQRLNLRLVDTGAIYRSVAVLAERQRVSDEDEAKLAELARDLQIDFVLTPEHNQVWLNGEEVTSLIRTPEISMRASKISRHPSVRDALLELQRAFAKRDGAVLEGRDIGTVVLPDAPIKFFLDASPEERARRRHEELCASGIDSSFEEVLREVEQRDAQDRNRSVAPLKPADDAQVLDSTELSVDEVVERIVRAGQDHRGAESY
ncbi:MAG: (d)CMP kinase [Myxococcota bacterium]